MLALIIAAAVTASQPGRDPALLHRHPEQIAASKDEEQEQALRRMLQLGGPASEESDVLLRLASLLRARGLSLAIRSQADADAGDQATAEKEKAQAVEARTEAITRYRELLTKYRNAPRTDEALFFLADTLQDSGRDQEAVTAARELTRRFPKSIWAPSSHVFIGEHLFEEAKLDAALAEYRAAAEVPSDEVYPYALYKAAWCRFNQSAWNDSMKLLKRVVDISARGKDANKVQLAREARRDYVLAYGRVGVPEKAHDDFVRNFGKEAGLKMLEQYGKLLFDTGRDPEAQHIARQLLALHGDSPAAALDQTRLLVIAQRGGKRRELLQQAKLLVDTFQKVPADPSNETYAEAQRLGEETLRNLAVQIHNEARKTDLDETWSAARALYSDYLTLFPTAHDAYDLRFFYGELLYTRGAKPEAAEQYELVVKADKKGKWVQKAAWSAVLSRNEAIFGDKEQKDTGERRAQRKLTDDEQKLAGACRLYLDALPEGPHAVEVAFKVGRLEYISGDLPAAEAHLSAIALQHPEHELAEYAANLVLDISNLRKDWNGLHAWAVKFLGDRKLIAHGTLAADLKRIEEESAYAAADAEKTDGKKAQALLAFVDQHPHGQLADKALLGAAAALSRSGRIDEAIAARNRIWKEQSQSTLVARALSASAADLSAVGDLGEAAALLEKYAAGWQKQEAQRKWRREHPAPNRKPMETPFEEAKAQSGLHDAAVLREARGEFRQALGDRQLAMRLWKNAPDRDESQLAQARLRSKLGEVSGAARDYAALARNTKAKPSQQIEAWHEAAKLYTRVRETGNANWSWTEIERTYRSLGPKGREKLSPEALAAAAEAQYALGSTTFDNFRNQQIKAPLMVTFNRKVALLQQVKKRAEATVAMRQAEPAVCALGQLGEAQILLGDALVHSPVPGGLTAEQRKLYRAALAEKAQPIYAEAVDTLSSADQKARELGVTGACSTRVASLLDKSGTKPLPRRELQLAPAPVVEVPEAIDAQAASGEKAKRLLSEAMASEGRLSFSETLLRYQAAAAAETAPGAALFDLAVVLDRAGRGPEAEEAYAKLAHLNGAIAYDAAARLAALAAARGDAKTAREAVELAAHVSPAGRVLKAQIELQLGNPEAAQAAARTVLQTQPLDSGALVALARARLALGKPGEAKLLAARASQQDAQDAEPLLVKADIARAAKQPAEELVAARAAAEADPDSARAALELGRALFERGFTEEALNQLEDAADMDPSSYPAALAFGQALAQSGDLDGADDALSHALALAPKAAEPHLALARLKLEGDGDAQGALEEAKLFLALSTQPPPADHPVHGLMQRCEEALKGRKQASVVQEK